MAAKNFNVTNGSQSFLYVNSTTSNVGVGTITPVSKLTIAGGVGIGTGMNSFYVTTTAPSGGMIVQGSVGIGYIQ